MFVCPICPPVFKGEGGGKKRAGEDTMTECSKIAEKRARRARLVPRILPRKPRRISSGRILVASNVRIVRSVMFASVVRQSIRGPACLTAISLLTLEISRRGAEAIHRLLAEAVVRRRVMQTRVEVEVGFVGRIPGAEDGPVVLLLHKNARPSASTRRRYSPARATYV
jgi:hypothetical protein